MYHLADEQLDSPRLTAKLDHGAPAADQIEDEYDDRDDQQGVDQATAYVHRKTQEPEHKEDSNDGVQHDSLLVCSVFVCLSSLVILLEQRRHWNPQAQGYLMQEAWIRGLAPCGAEKRVRTLESHGDSMEKGCTCACFFALFAASALAAGPTLDAQLLNQVELVKK
jgi:hypothetical protein